MFGETVRSSHLSHNPANILSKSQTLNQHTFNIYYCDEPKNSFTATKQTNISNLIRHPLKKAWCQKGAFEEYRIATTKVTRHANNLPSL